MASEKVPWKGPQTRTFKSTEVRSAGVTQWLEHMLRRLECPSSGFSAQMTSLVSYACLEQILR